MEIAVQIFDVDCVVERSQYHNGQVALDLVVANSERNSARGFYPGEPYTRATVCLVGERFSDTETAIKNYSENEGVLDALVSAGVVEPTGQIIDAGWVRYPVVRLLI